MNTFQVATALGSKYTVIFDPIPAWIIKSPNSLGGHQACKIEIGGVLYPAKATTRLVEKVTIPCISVSTKNEELMNALGVPAQARKQVAEILIKCVEDWRPVVQAMFDAANAEASAKANAETFERVIFTIHTSNGLSISTDNETLNNIGCEHNEKVARIKKLLVAIKYDNAINHFSVGGDYSDYSSWTNYEANADELLAIIVPIIEAKEAEKKEKEAKREAEKQAKFAQAKATGKPVELHSIFLTGSDIPRKYRDEDSDMGHLIVYAMPDGTTSEGFSHAY